jgi:ubiquinone/menaquinone biosynthesis C-methylase UbiE
MLAAFTACHGLLDADAKILDFGCGEGETVRSLCALGYDAWGCDIRERDWDNAERLRRIQEPYRIPYDDNSFDFIFSHYVFEHVRDYPTTIAELSRVLKPDGGCLHIFPSWNRLLEPHVYIPIACRVQSYWWIYLWSALGIRHWANRRMATKPAAEVAYNYLREKTIYMSRRRLISHFASQFEIVEFREREVLGAAISKLGRLVYGLSRVLPFLPRLTGALSTRVIYTAKPLS